MKNKILLLAYISSLLLFSCTRKPINEEKSLVNVDISNCRIPEAKEVLERIDLIPLETSEGTILAEINSISLVSNKYFIVIDYRMNVSLFDLSGKFISNSSKAIGTGPGQYFTLIDAIYNPYKDQVEILTSTMDVLKYDTNFKFIEKTSLKSKEGLIFHHFFPVDEGHYLLCPSIMEKEYNRVYLYSTKTKKIERTEEFDGVLAKLNQNTNPFRYQDGQLYFFPQATTYCGYKVEGKDYKLSKAIESNFQNHSIDPLDANLKKSDREVVDYLMSNDRVLVPTNILCDGKLAVTRLKFGKDFLYSLTDMKTKDSKVLGPLLCKGATIPEFFHLQNGVLYSAIKPFDIDKFVDKNLVSDFPQIRKKIKDEDNVVVALFHLK